LDDGLGTEQETQGVPFDINGEPLFRYPNRPMEEATAMDDEAR
jgi:hypothetical protein